MAEATFEICGHLHGALEVRKHRLHYELTTSPDILGRNIAVLISPSAFSSLLRFHSRMPSRKVTNDSM